MMSTRALLIRLAERRMRLVESARIEREALASIVARSDEAALLFERVHGLIEQLRRQPLLVAAGVALLVVLRPKRALGWLMKGWSAWRLYRGAQRWWQQFVARNAGTGGAA